MIIDAHNHPDWHGHNLERVLANMQQHNIDVAWVLSCENPADEYDPKFVRAVLPERCSGVGIPFERCLSYAARAPGKFVPGFAPDPRRPDAIDRLTAAVEIHGVRLCGELKLRMMYDNPDALRLFRFCGEKGLPVTVHVEYGLPTGSNYPRPDWWYGGGIEAFGRAIQACPETVFVGHGPGVWSHISDDDKHDKEMYPDGKVVPGGKLVAMLRKYPNLYCDTSARSGHNALSRNTAFTREFLIEFQDRVLYARDYFDNVHQELLHTLDLPKDVLEKIYCGNALKLAPLEK